MTTMMTRYLPRLLTAVVLFAAIALIDVYAMAKGPPPMGPPGSGDGGGMPWQVAVTFTANWVLAAAGVAILSRPAKRTDKPKKSIMDDEE